MTIPLASVMQTKRMLKAALERSGATVKAFVHAARAAGCQLSESYAHDALNEHEPQRFPLDLFVIFDAVTSHMAIRDLAGACGGAFVALPIDAQAHDELFSESAHVTEQLGEALMAVRRALADPHLDPRELASTL